MLDKRLGMIYFCKFLGILFQSLGLCSG